jgi:hypothetical protein
MSNPYFQNVVNYQAPGNVIPDAFTNGTSQAQYFQQQAGNPYNMLGYLSLGQGDGTRTNKQNFDEYLNSNNRSYDRSGFNRMFQNSNVYNNGGRINTDAPNPYQSPNGAYGGNPLQVAPYVRTYDGGAQVNRQTGGIQVMPKPGANQPITGTPTNGGPATPTGSGQANAGAIRPGGQPSTTAPNPNAPPSTGTNVPPPPGTPPPPAPTGTTTSTNPAGANPMSKQAWGGAAQYGGYQGSPGSPTQFNASNRGFGGAAGYNANPYQVNNPYAISGAYRRGWNI